MPRPIGHHLPKGLRRRAIHALQGLIAAGVPDVEAAEKIAVEYDVSQRSVRNWINRAYTDLSEVCAMDRDKLLGLALRRRRLVMSKSASSGDWKTYLAAADSEARLLGLEAPRQTEQRVIIERTGEMARLVAETIRDELDHDPALRQRFIESLQSRISSALQTKGRGNEVVIDTTEVIQIDSTDSD